MNRIGEVQPGGRPAGDNQQCQNTDREIWRKDGKDSLDPDNYYQPSIRVTDSGEGIAIAVGGLVFVKPVEEWHRLAKVDYETTHEVDNA